MSSSSFDVIVVGAGPAGCVAAQATAQKGLRTLILERRKEIGIPVQCGEYLPNPAEMRDLLPSCTRASYLVDVPKEFITNRTKELRIVSPRNSEFFFPFKANVIDRYRFDQYLATKAIDVGAEIRTGSTVMKRSLSNDITFRQKSSQKQINARVVIGADGACSIVGHSIGASYSNVDRDFSLSIQFVMDDIQCDSDTTEMYFGHQFAPGGYAWIIPKEESIANVGLGIRRSFASEQIPLRDYLTRFIRTHPLVSPRMKYAKVLQSVSAIIPVGGSHSITCSDNVILAGDAAGHIMASNGGGIPTALAGGLLAGKTAVKNILEGTSLFMYQDIWKKEFGAELESALSVLRIADQVMTSDSVTDCCMRLAGARYIKHLIRCRLPFPVELASKTIVRMLHWFDNEVNI